MKSNIYMKRALRAGALLHLLALMRLSQQIRVAISFFVIDFYSNSQKFEPRAPDVRKYKEMACSIRSSQCIMMTSK